MSLELSVSIGTSLEPIDTLLLFCKIIVDAL